MHLLDVIKGKAPLLRPRSPKWRALRKTFLKKNPTCQICGGTKNVIPHHIIPFYIDPTLELVESNLIALCEGRKGLNCHFAIAHHFNYRRWNTKVRQDAQFLRDQIFSGRI